ncbi:MAG TPA: hypothetical protein VFQ44_20760 [Streptosporangiaceae bacterium]|nr:hypothetical protein [Streptosporangiaceae bacterium]
MAIAMLVRIITTYEHAMTEASRPQHLAHHPVKPVRAPRPAELP